jgi:hypothetical protein
MSVSPDGAAIAAPLQFDAVEPVAGQPAGMACANCKAAIDDVYHQLNDHVVCSRCRTALEAKLVTGDGSSAGRFGKAALFGAGGGIAGAAAYAGVLLMGSEAGLLAVLVGYLVGNGVRKGSGGRGGWRYQALALAVTYLAVSASYLPLLIREAGQQKDEPATATASAPAATPAAPAVTSGAPAAASADPAASPSSPKDSAPAQEDGGGSSLLAVLFVAVSLPVLMIAGGSWFTALMLAIALYQAWKANVAARLTFEGPFRVARPVPVPAAAGE